MKLAQLLPKKVACKCRLILKRYSQGNRAPSKLNKVFFVVKNYFNYQMFQQADECDRLLKMYSKMELKINEDDNFIYFIDDHKLYLAGQNYTNGTIDYSLILNNSLHELKEKCINPKMQKLYDTIISIVSLIEQRNKDHKNKYLKYLSNLKHEHPKSLEEALQRILFINSLLWQTQHSLMGLGRMDFYLAPYIKELSDAEISIIIRKFLTCLHKDYKFKSNSLYGDTGQIIICGGLNEDDNYFCNKLTYAFINELAKLKLPDPKILLRVSTNTPQELLKTAANCIHTGIGSPLLCNDNVVIPVMINYGYKKTDAYNYVVSACWEPFPANVSAELNNLKSINYITPLIDTLHNEKILTCKNLDDVLNLYNENLDLTIATICKEASNFGYCDDLLVSCFNSACVKNGTTIRDFGATYNNLGVTGLGMPNVVDSLIAINELVFLQKEKTITELIQIIDNNFLTEPGLKEKIKTQYLKFGYDDGFVINLTNKLIGMVNSCFIKHNTGKRKVKFGLSSPDYIENGRHTPATPDGRCDGEPLAVHISCINPISYSELTNFASQLDYKLNCINGNVVDYFMSPTILEKNLDKYVNYLEVAIKKGFFEMQANVVSSNTLISAKHNPDKYKNLVVRVWGFSAYFNELPEEYKNLLIERALISEHAY